MPDRLIINIRGANGCGKSTLARAFLSHKTYEQFVRYTPRDGKVHQWPIARCDVPGLSLFEELRERLRELEQPA